MDFRPRKLPVEAAINLRICPIASVKPYVLMLGPIYVFMRANEKFVSVKGPMDFFTPEELERFKGFESFYLPQFVDLALPFRQIARNVRTLVSWVPRPGGEQVPGPAPFELSDALLRMVGPLWGAGLVIEPFFAAVFANELCDLLPEELLLAARERDVVAYERAILRSGWAVFLAVHLGYGDLAFLNRLHARVFEQSLAFSPGGTTRPRITSEVDELVEVVLASLDAAATAPVRGAIFEAHPGRAARKMAGRLKRVAGMINDEPHASIFGERGFVDG